ncbi:MAG: hypothetical protein AABX85_03880, partial [Nanoarchaeota archaeon]
MENPQDDGIILFRNVERIRKLHGDSARERFRAYEKARAGFNPKAKKTLNVYSINSNGELQGSNIFARALLDRMSLEGTRLGNLYNFLELSDKLPDYLTGTYEDDNAVVLRSLEDPARPANNYI